MSQKEETPPPFGQWREPAFIITYGASGTGKTVDALYTFPRGLFLALPGALKPSINVVGYTPKSVSVNTIEEATQMVHKVATEGKGRFNAVIIDDLSLLAENTHNGIKGQFSKSQTFALWDAVKETIITLKNVARNAGVHILANAHAVAGETRESSFLRGGPKLPGRSNVDAIPHIADTVLRVGQDPQRRPWKGVYHADSGNPLWHEKERHHIFQSTSPMNLGEGLRLAKYDIPRLPGLEWQEELASLVCSALARKENFADLWIKYMKDEETKGRHLLHIRWALKDGRDRYEMVQACQNALYSL
jgi:hypothetical protein